MSFETILETSQLGKKVSYDHHYDPSLLFPVPRATKRKSLGITKSLPFQGVDVWNAYEISWLNLQGKPQVALGQFIFPCTSQAMVESKSFKLYLNSFNQTPFISHAAVIDCLQNDLSTVIGEPVKVTLTLPNQFSQCTLEEIPGFVLDDLNIGANQYLPHKRYLFSTPGHAQETLHSHLFKSNCPITGQPDWASVMIRYSGQPIHKEGLLRYLISYRQDQSFHEDCAERIFIDIMQQCEPEKLSVYLRYTRRGGLDINPFRSNFEIMPPQGRNPRQ